MKPAFPILIRSIRPSTRTFPSRRGTAMLTCALSGGACAIERARLQPADGGGVHVVGSRHVRLRLASLKPRQSFLPLAWCQLARATKLTRRSLARSCRRQCEHGSIPVRTLQRLEAASRCVRATSAGASTSCTWSRTRRRIRSGRCVRLRRAATRQQFPDKRDEIAPPHVRPQPQDKASNGSN